MRNEDDDDDEEDLDDLFDERLIRHPDHDTSIAAAELVLKSMGKLRRLVLYTHVVNYPEGLTDAHLTRICTALYGERPESSYRKRRTDLCHTYEKVEQERYKGALIGAGWLEPLIINSGRRLIEDGSPVIVFMVNPLFIAKLERLFGLV